MPLTPPRDLTAELAQVLDGLSRRYASEVPAADHSHHGLMQYIAKGLRTNLAYLGWSQTAPVGATHPAGFEHAVHIPTELAGKTHYIPCSSSKHSIEVANDSTAGTAPVWRAVGPWRTDIENDPTHH